MKKLFVIINIAAIFLLCGCSYSQTVSYPVSETVLPEQTQAEITSTIPENETTIAKSDLTSAEVEQSTAAFSTPITESTAAENDIYTSAEDGTLPMEDTTISSDISSASGPEFTMPAQIEQTEPVSEPQTETENVPQETKKEYDFAFPVPEGEKQDESYFDDAVFIGNSRMVGFGAYSELDNITVYAHSGLNVRSIYEDACIETEDSKITILEALKQNPDCKKIYLKMGTNELGWPYYDVFIREYIVLIEQLREICPDALIYVHSILPVAKKKSEIDPYENQPNINRCNELLQAMCKENGYFYLDVQSVYLDEEGYLLSSVTFDGSHIRYPHYPQWVDYLLRHTLEGSNMLLPVVNEEDKINENIVPDSTSITPQNEDSEDPQRDMQPSAE